MKKNLLLSLPALVLFVLIFREVLFQPRQFCFRDAGFFYYPIFQQIQDEWNAGRLPLWDPCDNLGQPLAANPTSSVFYPVKLIFFLTKLLPGSFDFCYKSYILIHFVIAFWGMVRLGRQWNLSAGSAAFAAAVYSFSPAVLFQYCNVIFLVGAAWLPWAVASGDSLIRNGSVRAVGSLALFLALMVTGGDPQAAYTAGLLLIGLWFLARQSGEVKSAEASDGARFSWTHRLTQSRFLRLAFAGALGGILSGIVTLPAGELEKLSDRAVKTGPDTIWEIPGFLAGNKEYMLWPTAESEGKTKGDFIAESLFWPLLIGGGHRANQYDISVPPWRFPEFFWPNLGGNNFSRADWMISLPNERFWNPTLYFGILPLVFALSVFKLRGVRRRTVREPSVPPAGRDRRRLRGGSPDPPMPAEITAEPSPFVSTQSRWASWMTLISLLLALGAFTPVWLGRCLLGIGEPGNVWTFTDGDPLGGLYWFFSLTLPKFASFRFPAKFLTTAMIGLAVLSGIGFDRLLTEKNGESNRPRAFSWARGFFLLSAAALIFFGISETLGFSIPGAVNAGRGDDFRLADAQIQIAAALIQPMIILAAFFLLRRRKNNAAFIGGVFFLFTADMAFTSFDYAPATPESTLAQTPAIVDLIRSADAAAGDPSIDASISERPPCRFFTAYGGDFLGYPSPEIRGSERIRLVSEWMRQTLYPKHSGPYRIGTLARAGTMMENELFQIECWMSAVFFDTGRNQEIFEATLAGCDVEFCARQAEEKPTTGKILRSAPTRLLTPERVAEDWPAGLALWQNDLPRQRLRIVRPALRTKPSLSHFTESNAVDGEYVRLTDYEPNRLVFETRLLQEGDILIAEQYWPDWEATASPLTGRSALKDPSGAKPLSLTVKRDPLLNVLRQVTLPAGTWRVEMTYRPKAFRRGAFLTLIGACLVLSLWIFAPKRRKPAVDSAA